jgi:glutamate dehydrogenase
VLKNAVIVPTGAKGGFVLTRARRPRRAPRRGRAPVRHVRPGLLDVTDDLDGDRRRPATRGAPPRRRRPLPRRRRRPWHGHLLGHRQRGRRRYGFWLDDAFASGGSTATTTRRSASPPGRLGGRRSPLPRARHRRQQTEPITVVGIGDMSGDVFGNGCCARAASGWSPPSTTATSSSTPTRTRASFAERHGCSTSRARAGTTTTPRAVSPAAMIVPRAAKRVPLTDEVRELLRVDATPSSPHRS